MGWCHARHDGPGGWWEISIVSRFHLFWIGVRRGCAFPRGRHVMIAPTHSLDKPVITSPLALFCPFAARVSRMSERIPAVSARPHGGATRRALLRCGGDTLALGPCDTKLLRDRRRADHGGRRGAHDFLLPWSSWPGLLAIGRGASSPTSFVSRLGCMAPPLRPALCRIPHRPEQRAKDRGRDGRPVEAADGQRRPAHVRGHFRLAVQQPRQRPSLAAEPRYRLGHVPAHIVHGLADRLHPMRRVLHPADAIARNVIRFQCSHSAAGSPSGPYPQPRRPRSGTPRAICTRRGRSAGPLDHSSGDAAGSPARLSCPHALPRADGTGYAEAVARDRRVAAPRRRARAALAVSCARSS